MLYAIAMGQIKSYFGVNTESNFVQNPFDKVSTLIDIQKRKSCLNIVVHVKMFKIEL